MKGSRIMKALIIDDSNLSREIIAQSLNIFGIDDLDFAHDGVEALEKIEFNEYDLITLDLIMPKMDGTTVLYHIERKSPQTKVLICTGMAQHDILEHISPTRKIIYKPFTIEQFVERVKSLW
jgi:CheY-like chemotaxis protein